ncbi:MAG: FprA family A-type flavoprotein [Rikenellaceae bacterium]|jgi:flavorubredoxin|nr:FprA family A-type flavoprotein [Rikenellaceae bacterium]
MNSKIAVSERIFYLGVNDRRKHLFENIWPLPDGVSYNSYLICDQKTALLDTVEMGSAGDFVGQIRRVLEGRPLDYLIINHMEPDHSGEIGHIIEAFPEVTIVGNGKTFPLLNAYFGIQNNLMEVKEGDTLDLGYHKLRFVITPWVHWPETMMTLDTTEGHLFSADAFGTFGALDGAIFDDEIDFAKYEEEMLRYYSNIVGKYSNMVQKAFAKLQGAEIKAICPVHGPVWRTDPGRVIALYDRWSRQEPDDSVVLAYASMYGNNAALADTIARKLTERGVRKIKVYDVSKTHPSYIIRDAWRAKGIVLGTCSYNTDMFPLMRQLTHEFELLGMKNKKLALFGTHSWNGCGVKQLQQFAENIGWELVAEPLDVHGRPTAEKTAACDDFATAFANSLS